MKKDDTNSFFITSLTYGFPYLNFKHFTQDLIRSLELDNRVPWLYIGDFNEALCREEKEGETIGNHNNMIAFYNVLTDCGLEDLGFVRQCFTWSNKSNYLDSIQERFDHAVAKESWLAKWKSNTMTTLLRY